MEEPSVSGVVWLVGLVGLVMVLVAVVGAAGVYVVSTLMERRREKRRHEEMIMKWTLQTMSDLGGIRLEASFGLWQDPRALRDRFVVVMRRSYLRLKSGYRSLGYDRAVPEGLWCDVAPGYAEEFRDLVLSHYPDLSPSEALSDEDFETISSPDVEALADSVGREMGEEIVRGVRMAEADGRLAQDQRSDQEIADSIANEWRSKLEAR